MAVFPRTETEILAAAHELIGGLTDHPAVFPAPPRACPVNSSGQGEPSDTIAVVL